MRYIKSVLVGMATVIVFMVLAAGLFVFMWSGIGVVTISAFPWVVLVALVIFAAGFAWEFRRASRRN